jgi:hypothetical protein
VTFDPVPLYIICLRLGPSIPGVYVNPGFWTPKIRVLQWCMCIDFTNLNKAYPKDNFPLPWIDKIVDSAAECEVMSLLDCFSGYHKIYMEEDKASTSFITPFGTYYFIRMPEGLKNAGSTFSRLTKTVLESQVGRNIFTYVDNIVVASKNKEDHLTDLAETFANMRDARLRLNPEKCVFGVRQGEDTGLPGVAPRDRGQPDQDSSNHQYDTPAVNQGCPASDRQISRPQQIHFQVRRAESTFPQDTVRCKRLRMGTRIGGSLRITQATPVRLGNSHQSRPHAASAALHLSLTICNQCSASPRAR